ncbi:alpha/beta fold hydrolase [Streptomyces sp. NPDC003023]|uniref:alpha/beta fold hydrolase n=1 Tax=Streptomyces sp. NPDC003023 TaxID=3364675 RepID=UPI003685B031
MTTSAVVDARETLLTPLPVTERHITCAGVDTAVLEGGDGPPIVLLHGPGECAAHWTRILPDLVTTHRVVAPDLPGHGSSDTGEERLDADRTVSWLEDLVEQTCPSAPVVVGRLLGGAIAARFAAARPDRLQRLILVDSYGLSRFRPRPSFAVALAGFVARPAPSSIDRLFRACSADPDRVAQELGGTLEALKTYAVGTARTSRQKAAMRTLMPRLAMPAIPDEVLRRITVPTALIWGRQDPQTRVRTAEAASARYGWPLHVIDRAGDEPPMDQPAAFLRALRSALEGR